MVFVMYTVLDLLRKYINISWVTSEGFLKSSNILKSFKMQEYTLYTIQYMHSIYVFFICLCVCVCLRINSSFLDHNWKHSWMLLNEFPTYNWSVFCKYVDSKKSTIWSRSPLLSRAPWALKGISWNTNCGTSTTGNSPCPKGAMLGGGHLAVPFWNISQGCFACTALRELAVRTFFSFAFHHDELSQWHKRHKW